MKKLLEKLLVACAVCFMTTAHAVDANSLVGKVLSGSVSKAPLTVTEIKSMPSACITIGMGRIDGVFWAEAMAKNKTEALLDLPENAMAKNATWFHHFCWARLSKMRSINAKNGIARKSEIKLWRMNMQYIVDWTAKQKISWLYMPVVYADIAETFEVEKNYAQAIFHAEKALSLKSDYADAFVILADSYAAVGNKGKALNVAIEGLRLAPDSKGLKRRYTEFGGKMPYPTPNPANVAADAAVSGKDGDGLGAAPQLDRLETSVNADASVSQPATSPEPLLKESGMVEGPVKVNPYCRFCP